MRRSVKGKSIILLGIICSTALFSCEQKITAKEFMAFIKNEVNGYTRTFISARGASWTVTIAPKEYMALASMRTNRPDSRDFETAKAEYSDMTYLIIKTRDMGVRIPFECESFFLSGCGNGKPSQALMCQQVVSGTSSEREFLVTFPAEMAHCTKLCIFISPEGTRLSEIGCLEKSNMNELPSVKLY